MIDKELLQIVAMSAGGLLGPLGGWKWKWLRRFLLPGTWLVCLLLAGHDVLWSILSCIALSVAFCLPYGERSTWWVKSLVGASYAAATLFLGLTPWQIIVPVVFIGLFWLSNRTKWVPWKVWEFLVFGLVGVLIAVLM